MEKFMVEKGYQVIFLGQILDGFDENDVRENLMPHFKGRVDHLFENAPVVIKKNISYDQATQIANKMMSMGVMCKVFLPPEEDEIVLEMENSDFDEPADSEKLSFEESDTSEKELSIEETDTYETNTYEEAQSYTPKNDKQHRMVCPSCGFDQDVAKECVQCGVIIEKYQDKSPPKTEEDVFQDYIDHMSQVPSSETKKDRTFIMLSLTTFLIIISLIIVLGWSFHFFVYQKPWRDSDVESIIVTSLENPDSNLSQERIKSQKETIEKLKQALKAKKELSQSSSNQATDNFSLKSIPLPFLKHYQGKYVWVTCENGAVHQGTLYAVYAEQIILKKPRFNLTIPINRSMIKIVEYDLAENDYDDDAVDAYLAYKRRTEESLQNVSIKTIQNYIGKNIQVYLNSGQLYEGILSKCESSKITVENIVYGQLVTFVIQKNHIDRVLY